MATPTKVSACPVRQQLLTQFRRRLDHYTQTFSALLNEMSAEKASEETKSLCESCYEARRALHDHERDHRCFA